jgi:hypothetical protein
MVGMFDALVQHGWLVFVSLWGKEFMFMWMWPIWNQIFIVFLATGYHVSNIMTGSEWILTRF